MTKSQWHGTRRFEHSAAFDVVAGARTRNDLYEAYCMQYGKPSYPCHSDDPMTKGIGALTVQPDRVGKGVKFVWASEIDALTVQPNPLEVDRYLKHGIACVYFDIDFAPNGRRVINVYPLQDAEKGIGLPREAWASCRADELRVTLSSGKQTSPRAVQLGVDVEGVAIELTPDRSPNVQPVTYSARLVPLHR